MCIVLLGVSAEYFICDQRLYLYLVFQWSEKQRTFTTDSVTCPGVSVLVVPVCQCWFMLFCLCVCDVVSRSQTPFIATVMKRCSSWLLPRCSFHALTEKYNMSVNINMSVYMSLLKPHTSRSPLLGRQNIWISNHLKHNYLLLFCTYFFCM